MPDWIRFVQLAPGPTPRARRRAGRGLWLASAAFLVLAVVGVNTARQPEVRDPDRFVDRAVAREAARICSAAKARLASADTHLDEAARAEALLAEMEPMVDQLHALDVAPEDEAAFARWVGSWDVFLAQGRDRADALENGDEVVARSINEASVRTKATIDHVALVNGIKPCLF